MVFAINKQEDRRLPSVVENALDDCTLSQTARLAMWHLRWRLDQHEAREVKLASLSCEMHCKPSTLSEALSQLVVRGYLERGATRRPLTFRFRPPQSPLQRAA